MKIKIESDVSDIVERIKEIDDGYFILFDTNKNKFEVHNYKQTNSYCFTSKCDSVNECILSEVYSSLVQNIDKIIEEIDKNNIDIENNQINAIKNDSDYMFREMYSYFNNSSKQYDSNVAFSTIWR